MTVNNKEYDGTVTAPLKTDNISYSGLVEGDDFTGSYLEYLLTRMLVMANSDDHISYSGADAGNYTVTDQYNNWKHCTKRLTATASASNKPISN